jgi:hypothetical protein
MSASDVILMLRSENPLPQSVADAMNVAGGEGALRDGIIGEPVLAHRRVAPSGRRVPRAVALLLTAAVAAVSVLVAVGGGDSGPTPAFGAALVRFANASPRVLLQLPGWHVTYVLQEPDGYGEIHFVRGPAQADGNPSGGGTEAALSGRFAQLTWTPLTAARLAAVRKHTQLSGHQHIPTGLGVPVTTLVGEGRSRHWIDLQARFLYGNRILEFRATAPTMAAYRAELNALHNVTATTWLEAMPASVIKSANTHASVQQMLRDVPLPLDFDADKIPGIALTQNRYDLAVAAIGAVACTWTADWAHARATGDKTAQSRAIAAMRTAPHWPVFAWMKREGAWPSVLIGYARAMPKGNWYGTPLTVAANNAFGCKQLGIKP